MSMSNKCDVCEKKRKTKGTGMPMYLTQQLSRSNSRWSLTRTCNQKQLLCKWNRHVPKNSVQVIKETHEWGVWMYFYRCRCSFSLPCRRCRFQLDGLDIFWLCGDMAETGVWEKCQNISSFHFLPSLPFDFLFMVSLLSQDLFIS